jgi:hypothetical protein
MTADRTPRGLVGLVRLRDHCTFTWRGSEAERTRTVEVRDDHCLQCLTEARRLGYRVVSPDGKDYPGGGSS